MKNSIPKCSFKEKRYTISKRVPYYLFEEGIGVNGHYDVGALIDVRKSGDRYEATITAKAKTEAARYNRAVFSCTAMLYVNGCNKQQKKLQGGNYLAEDNAWHELGATSFVLPIWDSDVEIALEVGYLLYTNASMHGATNKIPRLIHDNVWKKLGSVMGDIRQKLLTL